MKIALFHGWELTGSGSNEYNRYLALALARAGHEVHMICREPKPQGVRGVIRAIEWTMEGEEQLLFENQEISSGFTLHTMPHHPSIRPVFVTDKQRPGPVKTFTSLTDSELSDYQAFQARCLENILKTHPVDLLHANHMALQPSTACRVCPGFQIPYIIFPHGSGIEYTVKRDLRFRDAVGVALEKAAGLVIGSREVQNRLFDLYPEKREWIGENTEFVGVGVDTKLFQPVERGDRKKAINKLIALGPKGGKKSDQERELCQRLDHGDFVCLNDFNKAYNRGMPDDGASQKLEAIPWEEGKIILFVGALTVGKGLQSLIAAMPSILKEHGKAHLVIVGSGAYREVLEGLVHALSTGNKKLLDYFVENGNDLEQTHLVGPWPDVKAVFGDSTAREELFSAHGKLDKHVHFLGRMNHDLLHLLFPCADLAVFPSIIPEAYPLVLMESLANGVLPMASDFSGFSEGLDELENEMGKELVDNLRLPIDAGERILGIAGKVKSLLSDSAHMNRGGDLRRLAVAKYDWSVRAEAMVGAYAELCMKAGQSI